MSDHSNPNWQSENDRDQFPPSGEAPRRKQAKGQPSGLWVLFITEMWERFSYYGMRACLVLYLVSKTTGDNPGFGWSEEGASKLYGWYTGLVYLTPIFGGWLADKFLGTHRSMLIGGWIIALGHFCLAATELFGHAATDTIWLDSAPGQFFTFMTGLVLIIIGTGFFKPCVSVMVGQLYGEDDPRRDSGFTIFYMGINVGAFLSGVVAGTLGEWVGWHWGFGSAGVGMVLGLIVYQCFRPMFLKGIGLPPHHVPEHAEQHEPTPEEIKQAEIDEYERTRPLTRVDWNRMAVIMILGIFAIAFWVAFEQAGSSLNLFAMNRTDREVAGAEFPATWYQSVNPAAIVLFAPLFAWFWLWLDKRGRQPSTPVKFAIGLMLLSAGYVVMIFGSLDAGSPAEKSIAKVPIGVKATILEQAGVTEDQVVMPGGGHGATAVEEGQKKIRIEQLTWQEDKFYDVEWTEDSPEEEDDREVRVLIDADGKLLNKKTEEANDKDDGGEGSGEESDENRAVAIDQVPPPVEAAILALAGESTAMKIQRPAEGEDQPYRAVWQQDGKKVEISVAADGNFLSVATEGYEKVGLAGPHWLLIMYAMVTLGELCLSPVGLSMVTKLSPARYTSVMMGLYFATYFVANLTAGYVAAFANKVARGDVFTLIGGQADFFVFLVIVPLIVGIVVLALSSVIKKMMHGLH